MPRLYLRRYSDPLSEDAAVCMHFVNTLGLDHGKFTGELVRVVFW